MYHKLLHGMRRRKFNCTSHQFLFQLQIPIRSVIKVSKEKTAKIIPNAVGLATATEKHVSVDTRRHWSLKSRRHFIEQYSFAGFRLAALAGLYVQVHDTRVEEGYERNTHHGRRDRHDRRRGKARSDEHLRWNKRGYVNTDLRRYRGWNWFEYSIKFLRGHLNNDCNQGFLEQSLNDIGLNSIRLSPIRQSLH